MTRAVQAIVDLIAAVLGLYYSTKYKAITKRLGLPPIDPSNRRGFIVLQIDGLGYDYLLQGMERGYAPYMQRMWRRQEYHLQPWRVGLPCTTPAVQAGILFGSNDDIPAFRWYDKALGEAIDCSQPAPVHAIQERLSRIRPGLLTGGSSYMNMFDGDASLSMFTLGAISRHRFFESVRGLGFVLLFLLNPFRTATMVALAIWEYATDLAQHTSALVKRHMNRPLKRQFRFLRVVSNVIFRDIQTFAVMIDIYRGVPAIYSTYYGYDEVAHQYGPLSKPALRALHAIDRRVRRIDGLRRLMLTREYDLFILSDHGMTPAIPFQKTYGATLGQVARDYVNHALELAEDGDAPERQSLHEAYLTEELEAIERNLSYPWERLAGRARRSLRRRVEALRHDAPHAIGSALVVRSAGSLSHLYLTDHVEPLELDQVEALAPQLVHDLVAHPSVWFLLGRQNGDVVLIAKSGRYVLGRDSLWRAPDLQLLAHGADGSRQRRHLARLARFRHAGDLVVMGQYDRSTGTVVCFEEQWACHGGLGGAQETAFILMDHQVDWQMDAVRDANDLYTLFARRYGCANPSSPVVQRIPEVCVETPAAESRILE